MANNNNHIYDVIKEINAKAYELKTKYKEELQKRVSTAYGEIAATEFGTPSRKSKPKFGFDADARYELMITGRNIRSNRGVLSQGEFLKNVERYNSIIDKAVSELAASIDGHGKKVINHIDRSNTTKEQDRQRWANKEEFKNLTYDDGKNYSHSDIKKTLEDYISEFIDDDVDANHGLNSNGSLEDFRYSVLERLSNEGATRDAYETWDLSEEFVREKLVKGTPGGYTSEFVSDETLAELNKLSVISKDQYSKYQQFATKQMEDKVKERDNIQLLLDNENGELYDARFNKYLEQKQKVHLEIAAKHDEAVRSIRENKKKVAKASNEIVKARELAKAQLEILNATKDMQHSKNKINFEQEKARIDNIIQKAINNKAKATEAVNKDTKTIAKLKSDLKNSKQLLDSPIDVQKKAFSQSLTSELDAIDTAIKNIKQDNIKMAEYVSNNVSHFWNSNDIKFKTFKPDEFKAVLDSMPMFNKEDGTTKHVMESMYELDEVTNTYKKRPYLLWNGDESLGLKGVTDITTNPHDIVRYFNLSQHGNAQMEEYFTGSVAENRKKAELKDIADKLRQVKEQQKNMTLDEKITAFRELNDSFNNPVEAQAEVEAQTSGYTTVNDGKEIITAQGEAEQFKWLTEDEAALIGDNSLSQLRGTQLGDELYNLSVKKKPVETVVDYNREYIDIINRASGNEELDFSRSQIKNGLESIDVLNNINDLFNQGTVQSIAEGKQALSAYSNNGSFVASNNIERGVKKLGFYGTIEDVNDVNALKSVVDDTIGSVVKYLDSADWDLINTIKEKTEYQERPDIVSHFQESLSENRREKIEMDRDYNGGLSHDDNPLVNKQGDRIIRTMGDQYEGEEEAWRKEIQKASIEYDTNTRDFLLRNVALENTKDEEISIIQKRQVEFVNEYIKKTHVPVKLRNLGKDFTLDQLKSGYIETILDNNNKPVPVQHFSEYYSLMSLNKLDESRDKAKPFTREEWDNKAVKIGDNEIPIRQFYEYYNQDVRKAQNDVIRNEIKKHNETINAQMEEHKIEMRKQTERANLDILSNKLNRKNAVNKRIAEFLTNAPELEEHELTGKVLHKDGLISSIEIRGHNDAKSRLVRPSVDNFSEIIDEFGIDDSRIPKGLFHEINDVKGFDFYESLENALVESDKAVENGYSSQLIKDTLKDELSNDDVEAFYKYKQNDYLASIKNDRVMYIPKGADSDVVDLLNDIKGNNNSKALHFKGDVLDYDVLEVGKDSFKVRPTDWIEANKTNFTFKFNDDFLATMDKANQLQDEMRGFNNKTKADFISNKNALKDGKLIIDGTTYSRMDLYNKMTNDMAYIDMEILDSNKNTVNKNIPIQKSALKVIDTNFTWMRKDPMMAGSLSADAELSVLEAMSEVTDAEVNEKFDLRRGAIADGSKNVVDITEEAITNRLKGKMLSNYLNTVSNGDTGSGLIRGARIALESENKPVNVETVSDFLRTVVGPTEHSDELSKIYGDVNKVLNDKAYLKQAIESDITNVAPIQQLYSETTIYDNFDINDDESRRMLYGEDIPEEFVQIHDGATTGAEDLDIRRAKRTHESLNARQAELAGNQIKETYGYTTEEFFNTIKQKYAQEVATKKVDDAIEKSKKDAKKRKERFDLSKTGRKNLIATAQKEELGKLNKKINNLDGEMNVDKMISIAKTLEKSKNGTLQSVMNYINKNPKMSNIAREFQGANPLGILRGLDKATKELTTKDFGVRLQSLREHVEKNGTDSLMQYINALSKDGDPFSGLSRLFSNSEIVGLSKGVGINNLEQYRNLAFLSDIVPGFDIEVQGTTANGRVISFNINDSKPNYDGGSGLVVKDKESGKWLPIVDTSPVTDKPVGLEEVRSLASTERAMVDTVKKLETQKLEQVPIFMNAGELKTTIVPNINFDFDKVASVGGGYGSLSPVQSLVNTSKLLDKAIMNPTKAMTMDYETTGLPDKLKADGKEHLFQPVQATIETFDIGHTGEEFKTTNHTMTNHYLVPTVDVQNHLESLSGKRSVKALVNDLDGNDANLLKNYAKYNMADAGYRTSVKANADGIDKVHFLQEVTGADGNVTQQWVESKYTPKKYVRDLQKNALKVTKFLGTFGERGEAKFINMGNAFIHDDKVDFMSAVIASGRNGKETLTAIGHNMTGAEAPWTKRWLNEAKASVQKDYDIAQEAGDEVGMKVNGKVLRELNQPFMIDKIDTMHLGKVIEPGEAKFNLIDSANRNGVSVKGLAHLAEVDVPKTTQLFAGYANTDAMNNIRKGVNSSIEVGDIIVKSGKSADGLQLDRGIYKIAGFNEHKDGGVTMNLLDLSNNDKPLDVKVNNVATLQKDAMETWTKFREDDLDIAKKLHNNLETVEANRTMKNAMTNLDTWMLHKQTGQDGGYGGMLSKFNELKGKFDTLGEKATSNLTTQTVKIDGVEVPSMSYKSYTDEEKFLYENRGRFQGKGYVDELNRLSEEVPQRRINANKAELAYMNSDEGKMVEHFLTESQNRLDAGVIDKKAFKQFNDGMRQVIHDTKLEAFQNGKMNDAMIIAPNKYNLGEVNVETIKNLGGSAHGFGNDKLSTLKPFDLTLDFTNAKTLSDSIWNGAGNLARNMHYNKQVASMSEGRTVALNRYVMPLLQQKGLLPADGDWSHITNIANNIVANDVDKVAIPSSMQKTLPLAVNHMMENKQAVTAKLAPLQEVNMMKGATGDVLQGINTKLNAQLSQLDKEAATRTIGINSVHSPELEAVNKELVNIARINRQDGIKATGGTYMPFYNYKIGSKNALAHIESLPSVSEFNLKNPVSSELGMQTAEQIKTNADALVTDRELVRPYKFRSEAINGNASRVANAMPEYMEILKRDYGYNMDHISSINDHIANDLEQRAYKPLYNAQVQAREQKAQGYQELSRRASTNSKYNIHNADVRQLDLENADRTKFNAMLQLGWAQRYQDAQGIDRVRAGRVGLPGQAATSKLLDPSKVLITSRASVGSLGPNGAVGLAYTDLSLGQLEAISKNQYTPNREKIMIDEYLKQDNIKQVHTDMMAKQNLQNTISQRRAQQLQSSGMPESMAQSQDYISGLNASTIEQGATRKPPASTPKPITASTVDDVIPESHFTQASREMRQTISEVGAEARGLVKEMMNSSAAKVAGIGLAFAGALALTSKQYTSDGGTADQKATGDSAPRVDGTYAPEYNGTKHDTIPLPKQQKTVRVEENGKGMNVKVRAKNRGNIPDGDITNAVSNAVNGVVKTDINIHQTDDRQSIDRGYVSNLFSQLLGGQ